jgi:hypothetical protein
VTGRALVFYLTNKIDHYNITEILLTKRLSTTYIIINNFVLKQIKILKKPLNNTGQQYDLQQQYIPHLRQPLKHVTNKK